VVVPSGSGGVLGGIRELLHNGFPTAGYATYAGEANGPASNTAAGAGVHFGLAPFMPTAAPISAFSFLVRRDSSATIQSLVGNGAASAGGWTFQLNYGAGQIGLTRWGIADNASTTLGAVPNTGGASSCVAMSLDGSNVRFFLNGRFQTVASGSLNAPSSNNLGVGRNNGSLQALVNTSIHVVYVWARTLSDNDMLALYQDPWLPLRLRQSVYEASALTGRQRVTQALAEAMMAPEPALRVTQGVLEVMVPQGGRIRVTQDVLEVMLLAASGTGRLRVSGALAEVMTSPSPSLRATQIVLEALVQATPFLRVTQSVGEIMLAPVPVLRVTQSALEAMVQPAALSVPLTGLLYPRGSVPPF
jgi:hypothetical protein